MSAWRRDGDRLIETGFAEIGAVAAFTLAGLGDMSGAAARRKAFGDERPAICSQEHGTAIVEAAAADAGREFAADGLAVSGDGHPPAIVIRAADCAAVYLFSAAEQRAVLVHAGRKGAAAGIVEKAAALFKNPSSIRVAVGPHIGACCYEIGGDIGGAFGQFFDGKKLDLGGFIMSRLKASGVPAANISPANICTCCGGGDYFSYRRQGTAAGRHAAFLKLSAIPGKRRESNE